MKWIVTSDLQFDTHDSYSTLLPSGITSRLNDMLQCWQWIVARAKENKCRGIVVVGDVFNSRTSIDLSVLDTVCRAFNETAAAGLSVIVVAGNHDSYLRSPAMNSLQVFRGCATVIEKPTMYDNLALVPWYETEEEMEKAVKGLVGKSRYLFTHVLLRGVITGSDKGIPLSALHHKEFKQVFLGDVHEPTKVNETVQYVGSPLQINFSDAGSERGVVYLDTESGKIAFLCNNLSPRFHVIEDATVEGIRENDFVRVVTDDFAIAAEAVKAAKTKTQWVQSTAVELENVKPRLDVRTSQTHADVLKKFCLHNGLTECDELVKVGLGILEEAKGA